MASEFLFKERVRIYDVDAQGVVHYSSYYRFFTDALADWAVKEFGRSLSEIEKDVWFVTVASRAEYHSPAYLDDLLTVKVRGNVISKSAVQFDFEVLRERKRICDGSLVQVAVDRRKWRAVGMPREIVKKLS